MKAVKDISVNIQFDDYSVYVCNHYCNNKAKKCNFYNWYTYLELKFIKRICENCALREMWGYNYKQSKGYKRWVGSC